MSGNNGFNMQMCLKPLVCFFIYLFLPFFAVLNIMVNDYYY